MTPSWKVHVRSVTGIIETTEPIWPDTGA